MWMVVIMFLDIMIQTQSQALCDYIIRYRCVIMSIDIVIHRLTSCVIMSIDIVV